MLSRTACYALNILGYLAGCQEGRRRAEEIARATGIPANYLSKILNRLCKRRIVESEKGWGGGFRLRPRARRRPIREILAIFDGVESTKREDCLFGLRRCDGRHPCPLHHHWERIREAHGRMLSETLVEDLARRAG